MKNRITKKRDIVKLGDRFAKYARKVLISVEVNELKKDSSLMAKELLELFEKKINCFRNHIKYCEYVFNQNDLTFEEKSLLARVFLVRNKNFSFHLSNINN